jgi:hypothetical protein
MNRTLIAQQLTKTYLEMGLNETKKVLNINGNCHHTEKTV